jgi:hypothetical protein
LKEHKAPLFITAAALLSVAALFVNLKLYGEPAVVILYATGSVYYALHVFMRGLSPVRIDSVNTGETGIALSVMILLRYFTSAGAAGIFLMTAIALVLFNLCADFILPRRGGERFFLGLFVNAISAFIILFLIAAGSPSACGIIIGSLTGFLAGAGTGFYAAGLLYICFLAISSALMILRPEISLLYHGRKYHALSGLPYRPSLLIITLINSLVFSAVMMCAGIFAGAALFQQGRQEGWDRVSLIFVSILHTQLLASASALSGAPVAITAALSLSLAMAVLSQGARRRALHD